MAWLSDRFDLADQLVSLPADGKFGEDVEVRMLGRRPLDLSYMNSGHVFQKRSDRFDSMDFKVIH